MSAKSRMLQYLETKGITQYNFSKETGLSNGFLKSGSSISSENMELISNVYLDLNLLWLVSGKGEMLKNQNIKVNGDRNITNTGHIRGNVVSGSSNNDLVNEPQSSYGGDNRYLLEEIERLKKTIIEKDELLKAKDEIIKSKDEIIQLLRKN